MHSRVGLFSVSRDIVNRECHEVWNKLDDHKGPSLWRVGCEFCSGMMPQTPFTAKDRHSIVDSYNFHIIESRIILPTNPPNFVEND